MVFRLFVYVCWVYTTAQNMYNIYCFQVLRGLIGMSVEELGRRRAEAKSNPVLGAQLAQVQCVSMSVLHEYCTVAQHHYISFCFPYHPLFSFATGTLFFIPVTKFPRT